RVVVGHAVDRPGGLAVAHEHDLHGRHGRPTTPARAYPARRAARRRGAARVARPLEEVVGPGWAEALDPVRDRVAAMGEWLRAEQAAGRPFLPAGDRVLAAFREPFDDVR